MVTNSQKAYDSFSKNKALDFYKQMNFCPRYFESAVEHFYNTTSGYETRYNSWVQCYLHFQGLKGRSYSSLCSDEIDDACVRLGFYMASWGMYRGSSFLLQNDYTIYREIIPVLLNSKYIDLWYLDQRIQDLINKKSPLADIEHHINTWTKNIRDLVDDIRKVLQPYKEYYIKKSYYADQSVTISKDSISKTLVTKLILGTLGCYPALDRYFSDAIKSVANDLSTDQIKCMLALAYYIKKDIGSGSIKLNCDIEDGGSLALSDYPVMKLIDMYYFTFGMEKPFLKLISELITGCKTIAAIAKETSNSNRKLLKQFILYNSSKMPPYDVDIAFPCSPLKKQNTLCPCCCGLDICNLAAVNPSNNEGIDYTNILDKLTDPNGELYEKISKISAEEAKKEDEE